LAKARRAVDQGQGLVEAAAGGQLVGGFDGVGDQAGHARLR
jgi:hypothetical protein